MFNNTAEYPHPIPRLVTKATRRAETIRRLDGLRRHLEALGLPAEAAVVRYIVADMTGE